jgi:DNA (cytosine-5)-methyltransferase 1
MRPQASDDRVDSTPNAPTFYEFFSGGGLVRAGLGQQWRCVFANDFDQKKARVYQANWGESELKIADVGKLTTADLPESADLAWASFPCQDLSLAGGGAGLKGDRSGTFWPFWSLMKGLAEDDRAPRMIVLENVCGTLTSHGGKDFATICAAFQQGGYRVGAMVIDAELFVPQSRPRLFVIGVRDGVTIPAGLTSDAPIAPWHTDALQHAHASLSEEVKAAWVWWRATLPPKRTIGLADLVEADPPDTEWFTETETRQLLAMMTPIHQAKVAQAKGLGSPIVGAIYKRTRANRNGRKVQRAEVRFDDISGCLRTPAGGSSRQVLLIVDGASVRARLISSRETARLMGLPDAYVLPGNYNEAYHLTGDGVVVPVVRYLAEQFFEPILTGAHARAIVAA